MPRKKKLPNLSQQSSYQKLLAEAKLEYEQALKDKKQMRLTAKKFLNFAFPTGSKV